MIDGRNFFDWPMRKDIRTCENIQKIVIGQGDDYTAGCPPGYPYFIEKFNTTNYFYWKS